MSTLKVVLFGMLCLAITFQSCKNDDSEDTSSQTDTEILGVSAVSEFSNSLDFQTAVETSTANTAFGKSSEAVSNSSVAVCANIALQTTNGSFPKTITVDFGTGCTYNSITRKGKLIFTYSDFLSKTGSVLTIKRDGYFVNGKKIEGTTTYTNQTNANVTPYQPIWRRVITDGKMTLENGSVFTLVEEETIKLVAGYDTKTDANDNVYNIYDGFRKVTRPNGTYLNTTIKEMLVKANACNFISKGQLTLKGSFLDGVLDYGDGTCDNKAIYTHTPNGLTYTISL